VRIMKGESALQCGIACLLGLLSLKGPVLAQSYGDSGRSADIKIVRVEPKFVDTPDITFGGNYQKVGVPAGTPTKWLRVVLEFSSDADWADNVDVRWYILPSTDEKNPVMFADSVTHINVKKGAHHYTAIYVPPRTVERFMRTFRVKQIAVQIWHNQKLMDTGGWPSSPKERWWEAFTPTRGALLNLLQTPFYALEYDRYEQIRVAGPAP